MLSTNAKTNYIDEVALYANMFLGDNGTAKAIEVNKNNGTVMYGIQVTFNESKNVCPVIYINDFDMDIKAQAVQILVEAKRAMKSFNMKDKLRDLTNFDKAKDMLCVRLVNAEFNKEMLKDVPHKIVFNDLAAHLVIQIDNEKSAKVGKELLKEYNKSFDELYNLALANTEKKYPCSIRTMEEIMSEMMDIPVEMLEEMRGKAPRQYVLTNVHDYFGAVCILYKDVLKNFAKEKNSDLIILPSSLHEVIIVLKNELEEDMELNDMITQINHENVDKQEWLSNHYYTYKNEDYYLVTITETSSRTVKVKASSLEEAEFKAEIAYDTGDIILDADDFDEKEITAREVTDESLDWYEELK